LVLNLIAVGDVAETGSGLANNHDPAQPMVDVLVVGAGPVGLLTAYRLRCLGLSCLVLEQRLEPSRVSRASTFQPATLDRLASLGLLSQLLPEGQQVVRMRHLELPSGQRRDLEFTCLQGYTEHPFRLHLEQHWLCALLLERLVQLQPSTQPAVSWGQRLVGLGENPAPEEQQLMEAWVLGSQQGAAPRRQAARWLVAADGAHSTVRHLLNLPFIGHDLPVPVLRLMLSQLPQAVSEQLAGLTYIRHPLGSLSALRMRTDWRLILRPSATDLKPALAGDQWARQRLAQIFSGLSETSAWQNLPMLFDHYWVSQRCVAVRQKGRCLLIGDAAHITNTRGGLNMNFGLLEGLDLAETLAGSIHHGAGDQQQAVEVWARRWQERTTRVLMPRTANLLNGHSPFEANQGNREPDQETTLLRQACLLDLNQS